MPRLAVIGYPVGHSRSPAMQNAALAALGLAPEWSYEAVEVAPEGFAARVREMAGEGFAGANVTIPHKEAALALADEASEAGARRSAPPTRSASAPTADAGPDAEALAVLADNTDAGGLLAALGRTPLDARALVLGAGGAARAAVWALVGEGAPGRGLEPDRGAGRGALRRSWAGAAVRGPRPGRVRPDRQHHRRRPARRGPVRRAAAGGRRLRCRPDGARHGLRRASRARCSPPPRRPAPPPSTASSCSSSRARSRSRSGPGAARPRRDARRRPRLSRDRTLVAPIAARSVQPRADSLGGS